MQTDLSATAVNGQRTSWRSEPAGCVLATYLQGGLTVAALTAVVEVCSSSLEETADRTSSLVAAAAAVAAAAVCRGETIYC